MTWFKNLRTLPKLMVAFLALSAFMGFVGYRGISAANTLDGLLGTMYNQQLVGLSAMKEANANRIRIGRELRAAILATDKTQVEEKDRAVEKAFADMYDELTTAEKTITTDEGRVKMARLREILPQYENMVKSVAAENANGQKQEALADLAKGGALVSEAEMLFNGLSAAKENVAKATYERSQALASTTRTSLTVIPIISVLIAIAIGYFIAQLIAKPLTQAAEVLERVAEGDLTANLNVNTKDEIGQMADSLNRAAESLRMALTEVRDSAENMTNSSQELAKASESLASGAQEQASSLEETTATLEEITSTVKQNADNAKQASQVAAASRDTAEKGGQVVTEAVGAMGQINASSKNIAEIITTIDEIAFQTNLLALNAAVEAARAGEQGRGFAVVATEVRNLAQRSATSAKEIKRLIQDSVQKVENGSGLVNKSGETLQEIVGSVKKVTDIVAEIAAASREQSTGIEQVNKAMMQMDQVTQTNSAQTEELSATAQSLSQQAEQLQDLVARFKVDAAGRSSASAGRTSAAATPKTSFKPARKAPAPHPVAMAASAGAGATSTAAKPSPQPHSDTNDFAEF